MVLTIVTNHYALYVHLNVSHAQEQQITVKHVRQIGIHLQYAIVTPAHLTIMAIAKIVTTNAQLVPPHQLIVSVVPVTPLALQLVLAILGTLIILLLVKHALLNVQLAKRQKIIV